MMAQTLMKYDEKALVVIRQTIMSIELLFIQIPMRHNFSLNYVEP